MLRSNPRRRAAWLCSAALALALGGASAAHAQSAIATAGAERAYSIAAGPTATALARFSEQSGLQLVYDASAVEGRGSPGVEGRLTTDAALGRLLAGTGLTWRFINATTVTVAVPGAIAEDGRVLGPVRVEGAQAPAYAGPPGRGDGAAQLGGVRGRQDLEARGYRPVVASIAAGAPTAIEDIPRSVSILTQEQMVKQDINDIGDAIRRMPGVTLVELTTTGGGSANSSATIQSRGQSLNSFQIDGGAPTFINIINNGLLDLGAYERVELVRGPNGVFVGSGSFGGSLNLVRKRPLATEQFQVSSTLASFDRRQLNLDYSTPSIAGTPFALRLLGGYQEQNFFYGDGHHRENALLGAIIDVPLGDKARLEGGYQFTWLEEEGAHIGTPRYLDGPMVKPFGFNIVPDWVYRDVRTSEYYSRFYIDLLKDWDFEAGVRYSVIQQEGLMWIVNGDLPLLSTTGLPPIGNNGLPITPIEFFPRENNDKSRQLSFDFRLNGKFDTWFLSHSTYIAGNFNESYAPYSFERSIDFNYILNKYGNYDYVYIQSIADIDPKNFAQSEFPFLPLSEFARFNSSTSYGIVLSDVVSWRDWVDLTLSVRRNDSENSSFSISKNATTGQVTGSPNETTSASGERKDEWRPSWALAIKPLKNLTIYGSAAEGSNPQSTNYDEDGKQLDPSTFENAELGVKYGREGWLLTVAGYDLTQTNVAVSIPGSQGKCPPLSTSFCYFRGQGATIKSTGVDVELVGEVLPGLNTSISYNYNDSVQTGNQTDTSTQSPSTMAKLFVDWRPSSLPNWQFAFGANYRDYIYVNGTRRLYEPNTNKLIGSFPFAYKEPPFLIFDARVDYKLSDRLSLGLLVENIEDDQYYSTVSTRSSFPGAARTFTFNLIWKTQGQHFEASPTTGLAPFGDPADWYGAFDMGVHAADDLVGTSAGLRSDGKPAVWTFENQKNTPAIDVRLGYRLSDSWRAELEGGWKGMDFGRIGGGTVAPTGVCGATLAGSGTGVPFNCKDTQGEAEYWTLLANVIHDFGAPNARLRPFLGAGAGLVRSSIDFSGKMEGIGLNTVPWPSARYSVEAIGGDHKAITYGWQALGGVSLRLTDRARIDATYRYQMAPKLKWDSANAPNLTPTLGAFKGEMKDQSVTVGLRWAFGAR
jgi:outer membrane receptor for ferric coprogen and ferric-rhodotorulic acid/opacity protein-like surface antigen